MEGGQQQQEQGTISNRPQTVSSLSSIDTAGYEQNDNTLDSNCIQESSLPPLPPRMVTSGNSTVITATSADNSFSLTSNNSYIGVSAPPPTSEPEPQASSNVTGTGSLQITSSTGVLVASTPNTNTVPEFLYQLTKMLTDNNRDIIEWSNGKFRSLRINRCSRMVHVLY